MTPDPKDQPKIPMMPFAPRPKNVYLVYGWEVGVQERDIVLFQKGEEAMGLGISLTMSLNGQKFFVGRHLGTLETRDGQDYVGCAYPAALADVDLVMKMQELGIKMKDNPTLYMIAG